MNETIAVANGAAHHHSALDARMVEEHCRTLRMLTVGASFAQLADEAVRTHQTPVSFLAALLRAEVEDFVSLKDDDRHLYLPVKTIIQSGLI